LVARKLLKEQRAQDSIAKSLSDTMLQQLNADKKISTLEKHFRFLLKP
jgi:hypothetical protein